MKELENIFTAGTEALMRGRKIIYLPLNGDYCVIGKIIAYNESLKKVTFNKVWDTAGTPENFYAIAKIENSLDAPESTDIIINQPGQFYRVGVGTVDFTGAAGEFQLFDESSIEKASFLYLIRKGEIIPPPEWDEYYAYKYYRGGTDTPVASFWGTYSGFGVETLSVEDYPYFIPSRTNFSLSYIVRYFNDFPPTSLFWETSHVIGDPGLSSTIIVEQAGTEVPDKLSLYPPGVHPYDVPTLTKYITIEEIKQNPLVGIAEWGNATILREDDWGLQYLVELGDRVTTTNPIRDELVQNVGNSNGELTFLPGDPIHSGTNYTVHFKTRKGHYRAGDEKLVGVSTQWIMNAYKSYNKYNPATDTTGSGDFCLACGAKVHTGFNEEANKTLFYFHDPDYPAHNHDVPSWSGITAFFYTESVSYKAGYAANGGRLYATRAKESWHKWNGIEWVTPNINDGFSNYLSVGDQWGGKQRHDTCNFMIGGAILFF